MGHGKSCFNCKAPRTRPAFCDDCWRMAIITSAVGGTMTELVHKMLTALLGV